MLHMFSPAQMSLSSSNYCYSFKLVSQSNGVSFLSQKFSLFLSMLAVKVSHKEDPGTAAMVYLVQ